MVAAATNNLCEAANSAVQGHASEEKLISSAKQVAASTAQLLVACKVKADHDSQTMKRLQVSQVKSSHLYLYSAFNNTNCDKATAQYQNGKIVSIM